MTPLRFRDIVIAATVAAAMPAPAAVAQSGRAWQPDERVLVTAFQDVGAVATDEMRRVYAATPLGVQVYDFASDRWQPPITAEDGYPVMERPTALAWDRFDELLWLGTAAGALYAYRPSWGRWERYGAVAAGPVTRIVPATDMRDDALYIAVPGEWLRLRRGSAVAERVPRGALPPALHDERGSGSDRLSRMDPFFESLRGVLTRDERLRRWSITDVVRAAAPERYWIATDGGSLFFYDSRYMEAEQYAFGLVSPGAGSVAFDGRDIWFGGDGRGRRRGVARADRGLQRWEHFEAGYDGAPGGAVHAILATSAAVWFAADDGLYRYGRDAAPGRRAWRRITETDGLPGTQARALAPAADGVWVGTRRGLVHVGGDGAVEGDALLAARRVHRLLAAGDTLWIASDAGLWLLARGVPPAHAAVGLGRAPRADAQPALRGRIVDVRPAFGAVYALAEDALYRYDGERWHGPIRQPGFGALGRLHALSAAAGQLWVAGDNGLARWDVERDLWTVYQVGPDIPAGPVRDVLPDGDDVWAATPAGALRLRWRR